MGKSSINGGFSIATFEYRMVDPGYPASSTTAELWKPSASRAPPWVGKLCRFLSHCPCRRHNPLTLGKLVILPFETSANHVGHHVHPASNHKKKLDICRYWFNDVQWVSTSYLPLVSYLQLLLIHIPNCCHLHPPRPASDCQGAHRSPIHPIRPIHPNHRSLSSSPPQVVLAQTSPAPQKKVGGLPSWFKWLIWVWIP